MSAETPLPNSHASADLLIDGILELLERCSSPSEEERAQALLLLPEMTSQELQEYYQMLLQAAKAESLHFEPVKD